jgi:hypothetical protein
VSVKTAWLLSPEERYQEIDDRLAGMRDQWVTPRPVTREVFEAALAQPFYRAQPWQGTPVRIHVPTFESRYLPYLLCIGPQSGETLGTWRQRFAEPTRPRGAGELGGIVLEGLVNATNLANELTFVAHDLLFYRDRWLLELPRYLRRILLEQAFAETTESGQARRSHWRLAAEIAAHRLRRHYENWVLFRLDTAYGVDDDQRPLSVPAAPDSSATP